MNALISVKTKQTNSNRLYQVDLLLTIKLPKSKIYQIIILFLLIDKL